MESEPGWSLSISCSLSLSLTLARFVSFLCVNALAIILGERREHSQTNSQHRMGLIHFSGTLHSHNLPNLVWACLLLLLAGASYTFGNSNKSRTATRKKREKEPAEPFVYYYKQIEMWICVQKFFCWCFLDVCVFLLLISLSLSRSLSLSLFLLSVPFRFHLVYLFQQPYEHQRTGYKIHFLISCVSFGCSLCVLYSVHSFSH